MEEYEEYQDEYPAEESAEAPLPTPIFVGFLVALVLFGAYCKWLL